MATNDERAALDSRTASILLGGGLAVATLLDFLFWSAAEVEVGFLHASHLGNAVALVGAAALACILSRGSAGRLLIIVPAALYLVVHAWHVISVANIADAIYAGSGSSEYVVTVPAKPSTGNSRIEAMRATMEGLRTAHMAVAALSCALSLTFAGMTARTENRLRDVMRGPTGPTSD